MLMAPNRNRRQDENTRSARRSFCFFPYLSRMCLIRRVFSQSDGYATKALLGPSFIWSPISVGTFIEPSTSIAPPAVHVCWFRSSPITFEAHYLQLFSVVVVDCDEPSA